MNPKLMHQIARDRRADLLRETEGHRCAGLTPRPTILIRIKARIPRFPTGSRRTRPRVVAPSTPGPNVTTTRDQPPEGRSCRLGRELVVQQQRHLGVGDAGDRPERVAGAGGGGVGVRRG
jgi:hypothetical protein